MIRTPHHAGATIDRSQPDWYKDAIIYQVHVKAFQDSDNDGVGDFAGLMQRLDHVQELGATAIWLLPFYPSPLLDDGYDIADFKTVNPSYGTISQFRAFVAEAHRRGLRVITELVINHTSDQHPWFQRARHSKPGSAARDFYVWSETDTKFPETRIIFLDTEKSNWTWDPVAGAFYWHRFYSHQPDLNFDNPRVLREVLKTMHFWLEMGVDGLRLDAIPYLVEREGTNNENLPETHDVLKKIRAELDAHYPDRMLLAEANQWPEDTRPYFGEGDECHMAFNFPLMPRMYMAVAQEDRHPITDIVRQTPDIPANCQWGIFLRNHDELTLEMVTDSERDYLWRTYAEDGRARINLGIRRRLAPLMQNDRRKIELMNSLLLSMPGTPIIYYGDEIGMGDNYYLGDRDGVRTPMQWSSDRNAGFSRANPQQLYLPVVMDPTYGYQSINVETQSRDKSSLLNWMRRMVEVRKQHTAFGRGSMTLLYPRNRKIVAYVREHAGEKILCAANLSQAAQAVELDLSPWKGTVPIEMKGLAAFPPVGELPYLLTLAGYGFFWFRLSEESTAPKWHLEVPDVMPELVTLTTRTGRVDSAVAGRDARQFDGKVLPEFLGLQRWFGAKDRKVQRITLQPLATFEDGQHLLSTIDVEFDHGPQQRYLLPLSARWGEDNLAFGAPKLSYTIAKLRRGPKVGALVDGAFDEGLATCLLDMLRAQKTVEAADGDIAFMPGEMMEGLAPVGQPHWLGVEQSNVSVAFGDTVILKVYRLLRAGVQPDVEVARFLTEVAHFENTPAYLGRIEHRPAAGEATTIAAAFAFVRNQGDAWDAVTTGLRRDAGDRALADHDADVQGAMSSFPLPLALGEVLGQRAAELHRALAAETDDPAFKIEPVTAADLEDWVAVTGKEVEAMMAHLSASLDSLTDEPAEMAKAALDLGERLHQHLRMVSRMRPSGFRSRIHGDFHLGQVLIVKNDVFIIDFEGEPRRSLDERRGKFSPLRDVAGMLRSLDYAAAAASRDGEGIQAASSDAIIARARQWRDATRADFLCAYFRHIAGCPTVPDDRAEADALLRLFLIQKAAYEVDYELANRPAWVGIALHGLLELIGQEP